MGLGRVELPTSTLIRCFDRALVADILPSGIIPKALNLAGCSPNRGQQAIGDGSRRHSAVRRVLGIYYGSCRIEVLTDTADGRLLQAAPLRR